MGRRPKPKMEIAKPELVYTPGVVQEADFAVGLVQAFRDKTERLGRVGKDIATLEATLERIAEEWTLAKSMVDHIAKDEASEERDRLYAKMSDVIGLRERTLREALEKLRPEKVLLQTQLGSIQYAVDQIKHHFGEMGKQCGVCYDGIADTCFSPCGHVFCEFCVNRVMALAASQRKCPGCRVKANVTHKVYFNA